MNKFLAKSLIVFVSSKIDSIAEVITDNSCSISNFGCLAICLATSYASILNVAICAVYALVDATAISTPA